MKKQTFLLVALFSGAFAFAQVGVNTQTPGATLDVVGKPTDTSSFDGVIAPRITGAQLRAKTYTTAQTGALVYVTLADTAPAGQTIDVTAVGYYYFNGTKWVKVGSGASVAATEPWYDQATSGQATSNTQNIYQTGNVSIGRNSSNGLLSVYDPSSAANGTPLYMDYVSAADTSKRPWFAFKSNLGTGSFSTLSIAGDQAFVFSVDADPVSYSRNALEFVPHTAGGGATPFGFKITEQGMFSFNAQYPTETLDLGTGTARIRNLPLNGSANSIYTNPSGGASMPVSTDVNGLAPTQTYTATRTVVADANGVLGYVTGLPATPVNIYNADGTLATNRFVTTDNNTLTFRGNGNDVTINNSGTQSRLSATGTGRGALSVLGGNSIIDMYADNNSQGQIAARGTGLTGLTIRTETATPISFETTNTGRMHIMATGNIGVNTVTPTEKLDNNGITRLRNLPLSGTANAIYTTSTGTGSATQDQTFTATRTVVADANGVLGYVSGLPGTGGGTAPGGSINVGETVSQVYSIETSTTNVNTFNLSTYVTANNLPALPILDGLQMNLQGVNGSYYDPRIYNVSSVPQLISYQSFATQVNENETSLNNTVTPGGFLQIDSNNIVLWTTTEAEVETTNVQVQVDANTYRWYEFKWWCMQIGTGATATKKIFLSITRKA